jgi:hypothetical protein
MATAAMQDVLVELGGKDFAVAGSCVLLSSGRPIGNLATTLASHALIHTAEGEFFRNALKKACAFCGLPVIGVKERELLNKGMATLGISTDDLEQQVVKLGKSIGAPWGKDEKLCAMAAWIALVEKASNSSRRSL